jgi:hypothetical protein
VFEALIAGVSLVAGAIASVAGFGIGSILTPVLSLETGTRLAVAAISVPHLAGTLVRFWILRGRVDRHVLLHFGILSAAGGLGGALLHALASNPVLTLLFAALMIFAGISGITGYAQKMRFGRRAAWIAGAVSGMLGGLVGNQGGIRSAALLGFGLDRDAFVATATAIGLVVDAARMPVYFVTTGARLLSVWPLMALAAVGVIAGTAIGARVLRRIPEQKFRRVVGILILALGLFMLFRAVAGR